MINKENEIIVVNEQNLTIEYVSPKTQVVMVKTSVICNSFGTDTEALEEVNSEW